MDDKLITDPTEILEAQKVFYANLYKQIETLEINRRIIQDINVPKLEQADKDLCDQPITLEELSASLKELPNNKTPGTDGLTTDFYKFFWSKIKKIVYDSIIYAFNNSILSVEQRRGILSIIPKKDKDLRYLKNWRPLTLMNTDYKILTKSLACCSQKVLPTIISKDQSGYLKGRFIGENIRTIFDTIEYTKLNQISGMMVLVDFEKAFDSISWSFLFESLKAFDFGNNFMKWIEVIYNKPECCVTNNGFSSNFFEISQGIRQGCPISALLFLLVVEIMSINIKNSPDIVGISVGNHEVKISQLADDTTLFLRDVSSLQNALDFLDTFRKSSGLKLNKGKTEIMWIGAMENSNEKPLGLQITNNSVRCLGILCNTDEDTAIKENFSQKIKKLKKLLSMWRQRNLSLKGKISFLKTMALPLLLYPASVLHVPENVIDEVDKLLFSFVWNDKKSLIKKEVLISNVGNGGLNMPHFESIVKGLKCTWIGRILNASDCKLEMLKTFINYRNYNVIDVIKCKLDTNYVTFKSKFYEDIMKYWYELYSKTCTEYILDECLWDNKFITIGNKPAHVNDFLTHGIVRYRDILDDNLKIMSKIDIEQKYHCALKHMDYNSVVHAIPKKWRKLDEYGRNFFISNQIDDIFIILNENNRKVKHSIMKCKDFTLLFLEQICQDPVAKAKWNEIYTFDENDWHDYYILPYTVTKDTHVLSLQYRIINRIFPCNYWLAKWNTDVNDKCQNCNNTDTLEHFFYECRPVHLLWNGLKTWWLANLGCTFNLTSRDIIFGILNPNKDKYIYAFNYCILCVKVYIKQCKTSEDVPNLFDFLHFMKQKLEIEIMYYKMSNLRDADLEKWNVLLESL